jgi:aspartate 1-decarboxylase
MTGFFLQLLMLKSKIHRARVTGADLNYEGSISIDEGLMEAADLLPYEQVHVLNLSNGSRAETYVIRGHRDTGDIILNGALARLVQVNDLMIILSYAWMTTDEAKRFHPIIVHVDNSNRLLQTTKPSLKTRRSH